MRTRILAIVGAVVAFIVFMLVSWSMADWLAGHQDAEWRETCDQLNAELIDTPKFYGCVRDGEVIYPTNATN